MSGDGKDLATLSHEEEPELLNVGDDWKWRPHASGVGFVAALVVALCLLLMLFGNQNDDGVDIAPVVALVLTAVAVLAKVAHQALLRYWGSVKQDQIP